MDWSRSGKTGQSGVVTLPTAGGQSMLHNAWAAAIPPYSIQPVGTRSHRPFSLASLLLKFLCTPALLDYYMSI